LLCGMTGRLVTRALRCTLMFVMMPETWLPTVTVLTGLIWPLAVTTWVKSPRVTVAVLKSSAGSACAFWYQYQAATLPPSSTSSRSHFHQPDAFAAAISGPFLVLAQSERACLSSRFHVGKSTRLPLDT